MPAPKRFTREERNNMTMINDRDRGYTCWLNIDVTGNRTWWLEGKHNSFSYKFSEKQPDNYTKFIKFLIGLRENNYDASEDDWDYYKKYPYILASVESWVTRNHLIAAAALCNYDENFLVNIRNKPEEEVEMFRWHMGLKKSELNYILDRIN